MDVHSSFGRLRSALLGVTVLSGLALAAGQLRAEAEPGQAGNNGQLPLPTGQYVTPTLATGSKIQFLNPGLTDFPSHVVGDAVKTAISPDGNTLLVLTSGYNLLNNPATGVQINADSTEYVFVFDISGANRGSPVQTQVLQIPNAYVGLAWPGRRTAERSTLPAASMTRLSSSPRPAPGSARPQPSRSATPTPASGCASSRRRRASACPRTAACS